VAAPLLIQLDRHRTSGEAGLIPRDAVRRLEPRLAEGGERQSHEVFVDERCDPLNRLLGRAYEVLVAEPQICASPA